MSTHEKSHTHAQHTPASVHRTPSVSAHAGPCWSPTEGSAHTRQVLRVQCTLNHTGHMLRAQYPQKCPPRGHASRPHPTPTSHHSVRHRLYRRVIYFLIMTLGPLCPGKWVGQWARPKACTPTSPSGTGACPQLGWVLWGHSTRPVGAEVEMGGWVGWLRRGSLLESQRGQTEAEGMGTGDGDLEHLGLQGPCRPGPGHRTGPQSRRQVARPRCRSCHVIWL